VHRDLKPENVIGERSRGGALAVKILDFGLAKLRPLDVGAPATHTISGVVVGTFGYMSPEQLLGRDVDERTDIFAIGVMVVEVVSGQRPFDGEGYYELLRAMLQDDYHLPGASRQARALDAVMQRCLAKHPQDRFASAAALRRELVPALRAFSFLDSPMPGDSQVFRGAGPVISR
jgi:serine/threonine-protein kinase